MRYHEILAMLQDTAAGLLARPPPDPDAATRVDLRGQRVVTIDDESTREIDDGLAVEHLPGGGHRLWVHVADPTRWLNGADHPLCVEALARTRTLYLPTGTPSWGTTGWPLSAGHRVGSRNADL
jgi:exoribonuclease-2